MEIAISQKEDVMKRFIKTTAVASLGVMLVAGAAFAGADDPVIQKREQNQERRIQQGEKSGELTPKEAGKLEAGQTKIKQDEQKMKADGKLTKEERRKLTREQNKAGKDIYRKKHNKRKAEK